MRRVSALRLLLMPPVVRVQDGVLSLITQPVPTLCRCRTGGGVVVVGAMLRAPLPRDSTKGKARGGHRRLGPLLPVLVVAVVAPPRRSPQTRPLVGRGRGARGRCSLSTGGSRRSRAGREGRGGRTAGGLLLLLFLLRGRTVDAVQRAQQVTAKLFAIQLPVC